MITISIENCHLIDPYTGEVSEKKTLEYPEEVKKWKVELEKLDAELISLTTSLPEESDKWFWLETESLKRIYWLYELKLRTEKRLRFAKYGSMAILTYNKRRVTINASQDPTSATIYEVGKKYRGKELKVKVSEAYGSFNFHVNGNEYHYSKYESDFERMHSIWGIFIHNNPWFRRVITKYFEYHFNVWRINRDMSKYLKCPGFDIRHFEECAETEGTDYYHGEMKNPFEFQDPMGCLADYE